MEPSAERHSSLLREDLSVSQQLVSVGGHDDVGGLNGAPESRVGLLTIQHQLQEAAVQLVHSHDWPDTLNQGLQAAGDSSSPDVQAESPCAASTC